MGNWGVWSVLFVFICSALICLLLFPLCPESPGYVLIKKNNEDGTQKGPIPFIDVSKILRQQLPAVISFSLAFSWCYFILKLTFCFIQVYLAHDGIEMRYIAEDKCLHHTHLADMPTSTSTTTVSCMVGNSSLGPNYIDASNVSVTQVPVTTTLHPSQAESKKVALFVFFGMVGAILSGMLGYYFGRKKEMLITTIIMFVASLFGAIQTMAQSPECLMISKIFVGLHNGIVVSLTSLYLAEILPKKIRGAVGTCHQLFVTISIQFSMILGLPELAGNWGVWSVLFAFNAVPALICRHGSIPFIDVSKILLQELCAAISFSLAFSWCYFILKLTFCFIQLINIVSAAIGLPALPTPALYHSNVVSDSVQTLLAENQRLRRHLCIGCCKLPRQIVYIPCGHCLFCTICHNLQSPRNCPVCHSFITSVINVRYS